MDEETAAILHNAEELSRWAAQAVVDTDALIAKAATRPLSPGEQQSNLVMQRELLVRMSQQQSLLAWACGVRAERVGERPMAWWRRWRRRWVTWRARR